jgi:hypothetical protein
MTTATHTQNIQQTLVDIADAVEKIKNDQMQHFPEAASIGDAVRQGDIYIQLIDERDIAKLDGLYSPVAETELGNHLQLAPGNTKGSRHIIQNAAGLTMWLPNLTDAAVVEYMCKRHGEQVPENTHRFNRPHREECDNVETALAFAGPIFKCATPNVVAHPEHGDWYLPIGVYRVIFQRTVDEDARIRRVLD